EPGLRRPGLRRGAFAVVYPAGVLHPTPNPRVSFARLARLARPGGTIVLGVYNVLARLPSKMRSFVARLSGFRFVPFDPVLIDRRAQPMRPEAWLRDQYRHPREHGPTLAQGQEGVAENRANM